MKCRKVSHLAHNFENSNFPRLIRQFAKCHSQSATPLLLHAPHSPLSLSPSLACDFTVASASIIFQMYIYYRKCKTTSMKAAPREGIRNSGRKVFVVCVRRGGRECGRNDNSDDDGGNRCHECV